MFFLIECFKFSSLGRRCPLQKALNQGDKRGGDSALEWEYSWYLWEKKYFWIKVTFSTGVRHFLDIFENFFRITVIFPPQGELQCLQHSQFDLQRLKLLRLWHRLVHCGDILEKYFELKKNSESVQNKSGIHGAGFFLFGHDLKMRSNVRGKYYF